jgi:hypothetical protein
MLYRVHLTRAGFELATLGAIDTDCIGSYKSNYHTITTMMAPSPNTVVSNHFHSVKILLFSSARSRDFDGTPGTELPVSMYTIKTHNRYVPF